MTDNININSDSENSEDEDNEYIPDPLEFINNDYEKQCNDSKKFNEEMERCNLNNEPCCVCSEELKIEDFIDEHFNIEDDIFTPIYSTYINKEDRSFINDNGGLILSKNNKVKYLRICKKCYKTLSKYIKNK